MTIKFFIRHKKKATERTERIPASLCMYRRFFCCCWDREILSALFGARSFYSFLMDAHSWNGFDTRVENCFFFPKEMIIDGLNVDWSGLTMKALKSLQEARRFSEIIIFWNYGNFVAIYSPKFTSSNPALSMTIDYFWSHYDFKMIRFLLWFIVELIYGFLIELIMRTKKHKNSISQKNHLCLLAVY